MSRVQLALNVADLDEAISFYSRLFATEPAKVRPGYANFAVAEPPLKLVLIENGKVFRLEAGDDVAVFFHQRLRADHSCGGAKGLCEHDGCQHAES